MREPKPFFRKQTNSWYVQVGKVQVPLGQDRKAAFEKYHEIMADSRKATGPVYTVGEVLTKYLDYCKANLAESTFSTYLFHLKRFVAHVGKGKRVETLKAGDIQEWIDTDYAGKSGTYKSDAVTTTKTAFKWAADMGHIKANPIANAKKPARGVREMFVESVDWTKVIEAASDLPFREYMVVAFSTGARPHEMRTMEAHFYDKKFSRVVFPRLKSKGKKRQRVIYLDEIAGAIVERLCEDFPSGPIFRNRRGEPWKKNAIKDRFRRLREKLGIPGLCATVLRHSYAHQKLIAGEDSLVVSKLLGHVDGRMLATRYGHLEANATFMLQRATQNNPLREPSGPDSGTSQAQSA
jgi:integrase